MPETRTTYPESNMCNTQLRMLYNNFVFSREVLSGIFVAKPFFNYNSCDKRALTRIAYSRLMIPEFLGRFARFPQSGCGRALSPATVHLHINTSFDGLETFDRTILWTLNKHRQWSIVVSSISNGRPISFENRKLQVNDLLFEDLFAFSFL